MQFTHIASLLLIVPLITSAAAAAQPPGREQSIRLERCESLHSQYLAALASRQAQDRTGMAETMGAKASTLCAAHKEAQGARAYVKALSYLGVRHVDVR
ncbi:hypothetical protein [Rhizobium sp. FKL33]|uniref:hypothetical protein n=1 Tax=Rhizobium sp. FKL33 TaxID=2562307 RepID=UPI0010C1399E|nr:hypothetical protein [Rhizobium sp. FKL33]